MITHHISRNQEAACPLRPIENQPAGRILMVDDEPLICRLNAEVLTEAGYQVDTARDGAVAWHTLHFNRYNLLITDNDMPNMTGVNLLILLRTARMSLPAIMVSATLPDEVFRRNVWLQPIFTLSKPYYIEELLGMVRTVLRDTLMAGGPTNRVTQIL